MKLKRATFRHIEAEICEYHKTLAEMDTIRRDIINASTKHDDLGVPLASGGGSVVETRGTKLADSILLREMERITEAIRDTYEVASEEGKRVIWIRYGLCLGWYPPRNMDKALIGRNRFSMTVDEFCEVLSMDPSTYHRYRTGFVYGVAKRLGWY